MPTRRRVLAALGAVGAVTLAGCGTPGDGGGDGGRDPYGVDADKPADGHRGPINR